MNFDGCESEVFFEDIARFEEENKDLKISVVVYGIHEPRGQDLEDQLNSAQQRLAIADDDAAKSLIRREKHQFV